MSIDPAIQSISVNEARKLWAWDSAQALEEHVYVMAGEEGGPHEGEEVICKRVPWEEIQAQLKLSALCSAVATPMHVVKEGRGRYLVMEYASDGCVLDYMKGKTAVIRDLVQQVLSAGAEVHSNDWAHGDLNASNLRVKKLADGSLKVVLIDFDSASVGHEWMQSKDCRDLAFVCRELIASADYIDRPPGLCTALATPNQYTLSDLADKALQWKQA